MKINKKINKLGLMLTLLLFSTSSFCINSFSKNKELRDVKAELKSLSPAKEKLVSRDIKILEDGIKFKKDFIPKTNSFRVMTVRITVYWARGGDTDSYSARKKSSTGYTLKEGDSIAVDPIIIPYNKEVIIPNVGLVRAVDTGTDVKNKKASNGKLPVIDVFFENKKDALSFASNYPKIVKVIVLN
jgi:3D (Asp-Asp-Asp) domain-containing protein